MRVLKSLAVLGIAVATCAQAQISTIDSASIRTRVFNDIPSSTVTVNQVMNPGFYPLSILLQDNHVSAPTGFANRHTWNFSSNHGVSPYLFQDTDYFHAAFDLTLTGSPIAPRKESGWLLSSTSVGDIQFIVNTDGHEVVQFGGISFYSFGNTFNSGDTINLGMNYFLDGNGRNALQFSANGVNSPVFEFPVGQGIGNGSTLGGYFQIVNDPANPNNAGSALFDHLVVATPVPEPTVFALAGFGFLAVLLRRRAA